MFRSWFGTRTHRPLASVRSVRPWLELLEDRLTPSGGPPGPGPGPGPGGPPPGPNGPPPPPPPGPHQPPPPPSNMNTYDSYNTTTTDSYNTSINNVTVNQYQNVSGSGSATQQAFAFNAAFAAQINLQALFPLIIDEAQLAIDTYQGLIAGPTNNSGLTQQMHDLQYDIQMNPLESTSFGASVGYLTFDLVLNAMILANSGAGAHGSGF